MLTDATVGDRLLTGATLEAPHCRIRSCVCRAQYQDAHGVLEYWLDGQLARLVRCPSGLQACLDAMETVARWRDWSLLCETCNS